MTEEKIISPRSLPKWLKWFLILLFVLILLFLLLSFALTRPKVQNWAVDKIATNLSEKLEADVNLDSLSLDFRKGLELWDFSIVAENNDTLIYTGSISSSFGNNLSSLFHRELMLDELYINELSFKIETEPGAEKSNIQLLLDKLSNDKSEQTDSKPFLLDLKYLELNSFQFEQKNEFGAIRLALDKGEIAFNSINIDSLIFDVDNLKLSEPDVLIQTFKKKLTKSEENEDGEVQKTPSKFPQIAIQQLLLENANIQTKGLAKNQDSKVIDYNNFTSSNTHLELSNIQIQDALLFSFALDALSANINNELQIESMTASTVQLEERKIVVDDYMLKTDNSELKLASNLKFRSIKDFENFEDKVFLDLKFDDSKFALNEIAYLVPGIMNNRIVTSNLNEIIYLDGQVKGRVNNFSTQELALRISDKVLFNGFFRARNITEPDNATINVQVDQLFTTISDLKAVIPDFKPPANFNKLGNLNFKGRFDGFVYNFVAFGDLQTNLGRALTDIQLDLTDGRGNAGYSGNIELIDFNLSKWSDNPDFGIVSFRSDIKNGYGLTINSAKADLSAALKSFEYKGYLYQNVLLDGNLEKNKFQGNLQMEDPNADFNFDGFVSYVDGNLESDFVADVSNIDLNKLNITKDSLTIAGDLNVSFSGSNLDNFQGNAILKDLEIELNNKLSTFDSISISSTAEVNKTRSIAINSEEFDLNMNGQMNFNTLVRDVKGILKEQHPAWANYLNVPDVRVTPNQNFVFNIFIANSQNLLSLLEMPDLSLNGFKAIGRVDTQRPQLRLDTSMDEIIFNNNGLKNLVLTLDHHEGTSMMDLLADSLMLNTNYRKFLELKTEVVEDKLQLNVIAPDILDSLGSFDFIVNAVPYADTIELHFVENMFTMLDSDWFFDPENKIRIGKKSIDINNFILEDGDRMISLQSRNSTDVLLNVLNLDFELLNPIIDYENIYFTGPLDVIFQADNIFEAPNLNGSIQMEQLYLNGDPYGVLTAFINQNQEDMLDLDLDILRESDGQHVELDALIDPKKQTITGNLKGRKFGISLFEYIIKDAISETTGTFDLDCEVRGKLPNLVFRGKGIMRDCGVKVDYIGNYFTFDKQEVRITENIIDVTGATLEDIYGNEAVLEGGILHNFFKDLRLNLKIAASEFLMLNTDRSANSSYYGTGIGNGNITFSGPMSAVDIVINATSLPGTVLSIPVESSEQDFEESFITFVEAGQLFEINQDTIENDAFELSGTNVEMNLTLTPDAEIRIIFDEQLNDVISGRGRGNIRMVSERTGTFDVFGQYVVETGEYLFTALGIVAKPFTVKRGGTIVWTGDPLNAYLNIEADYSGIKSPTNVFLAEYLTSDNQNLNIEARAKTRVDLSLLIGGTLYNPEINFDFEFPELQGELKSYSDNKMVLLRQNPADMNDQVASLLLFGAFLPSNNPLGDNFVTSSNLLRTGYNTLSEFVSQQLSYLLSGLIEEALIEDGLLQGVDFEIGFSKNAEIIDGEFDNSGGLAPDEIEVNFKPKFKNDRWNVDLGTNYVRESTIGINNYVFYDYVLEYALTKDRRLKLKVYGKNDFDEIAQEREWKYGVGVSLRKEFGTLAQFKEIFKKDIKASLDPSN